MKKALILVLVAALFTTPALAEKIGGLRVDPQAKKLCAKGIYDNSVEGVWFQGKKAMLAFRLTWDNDGSACYAWLNKQPNWNIGYVGSSAGKVRKVGKKLRYESENVFVTFNKKTGRAQFQRSGGKNKTAGRLIGN